MDVTAVASAERTTRAERATRRTRALLVHGSRGGVYYWGQRCRQVICSRREAGVVAAPRAVSKVPLAPPTSALLTGLSTTEALSTAGGLYGIPQGGKGLYIFFNWTWTTTSILIYPPDTSAH
jgi:hypothetical protein